MNIPLRNRIIVTAILALIVAAQCYPAKTKKGGGHHRRHHRGHGKSNTKKDSVNQRFMGATMMRPGKLGMSEEREMDNFQDYNKAFMNSEMAAESSLLANQGIDDDSALKISNMAAMPNGMEDRASSKKAMSGRIKGNPMSFSKPNVAGFQPDEYLLDANSWPEYRIKDSDYNNKNYRVFPQGGGYQGGYMGAAMPYGQTAAAGMEGPYGDGNYGFPPAGAQRMVNDEQEQAQEQAQEQEQDQPSPVYQDEGTPMSMPLPTDRKMRHHRKMKNPASENYGDEAQPPSKAHNERGSGSGNSDGSGSGSHDTSKLVPGMQDQGKAKTGEGAGKVTVDTKPDGTVVTSKADSSSTGSPVKSEQSKTESKAQETSSPQQTQNENSSSKGTENTGSSSDSKEGSNSDAAHSTLGDFAKFLKSKGITLTINKENKDANKPQTSQEKENSSPAKPQQEAGPQTDKSGASAILPSTGEPTSDTAGNPTINISPQSNDDQQVPERPLHTGVMRWQNLNMAPQEENQMGELFLRHKTKPHH